MRVEIRMSKTFNHTFVALKYVMAAGVGVGGLRFQMAGRPQLLWTLKYAQTCPASGGLSITPLWR